MRRKRFVMVMTVLLTVSCTGNVWANSAQSRWRGTDVSGAVVTEEECPLMVERERLTFDLTEFPENGYDTVDDYLAYTGNVSAQYTIYNPADYTVEARLVFPFGNVPDYGFIYEDGESVYNMDTEKYDVTVNGRPVEKKLRHTFSSDISEFELGEELEKLSSGSEEDGFYSPDLPVTKYTYRISGIDTETYSAASAGFLVPDNRERTKVYLEQGSGFQLKEDEAELSVWAENGAQIELYVIGEPLEEMPEWYVCEDGGMGKRIDGEVRLTKTEKMTFRDLALMSYDEGSSVMETDWYHAVIDLFERSELDCGVIGNEFWYEDLDLSGSLMRWYEYEIVLAPGERIVNEVTAPIYPSIDGESDPAVYGYTYLLSPARTWKEFKDLEVTVNTPYYLTESSLEGFEKTEEGYSLVLDGLPQGELSFTLCEEEGGGSAGGSDQRGVALLAFLLMGGVGFLLILTGGILVFLQKRKTKACTSVTMGYVVDHRFPGDGRMYPIVEYQAAGHVYRAARRFRGYITTSRTTQKHKELGRQAYVSEKDYVHVVLGRVANVRAMAEDLWPLGSPVTVYYDPDRPSRAYVEKMPEKAPATSVVFLWVGIGVILCGILLSVLIGM